jgi:SAM-dependent methyltransferase
MSLASLLRRSVPGGAAERQSDEPGSPWWGEHQARYLFATRFFDEGAPTLDIACGTGYGVGILRQHGAVVCGVDVDAGATQAAARLHARGPGTLVLRGDGRRLPFASGRFRMITSFETIEHLHERAAFTGELSRVLAPEGVCLISTPNALYTRPVDGKPSNPFHVHEYQAAELQAELRPHFAYVQIVGQVLDGRFRVPPFWTDQQRLPRTPAAQAGLWTRRFVQRLPLRARDPVSRAIWGHQFFPVASDYHFDLARVDQATVLVAICSRQALPPRT